MHPRHKFARRKQPLETVLPESLEQAFREIDRPARHDVTAEETKPLLPHPGVKGNHHGRSA
jgi:hypothetical protein